MLGHLFTRPAPAAPVEDRAITEFTLGSGVVMDGMSGSFYRGGLGLPGAWRAATLLADLLGAFPWSAYRERGDRPVEKLPMPTLLDQPHPPETRVATFSALALDLVMHGNAIGVYSAYNSEGWPTAIVPVPADQVGIRRTGADSPLPRGTTEYAIGDMRFGSAEVLHVKGHCRPGELRGRGVLELHLDTLELAQEQGRQARNLSKHGVPTGTLKSLNDDLTEPEAKALKAAWLAAQRDRSIAVLNSTTEFTPLSWNPAEMELVEARKFSLQEIALIFGIPASFLGVEAQSMTYSNTETEGLNLLRFSLMGHLARFEQSLAQAFPRGTWVKANTDALLRADTLTRYQAHAVALQNGFLLPSEVRAMEERPPIPGQDEKFLNPPAPPAAPPPAEKTDDDPSEES